MSDSDRNRLLRWNTMLWIVAIVLPAFFSFALASTKFPWQIVCALLLVGPMIASNKMLTQAIGQSNQTTV